MKSDGGFYCLSLQLGGGVLSRDNDFFRYHTDTGSFTDGIPPYQVFSDFTRSKGELLLWTRDPPPPAKIPFPRKIMDTLPKTENTSRFLEKDPYGQLIMRSGCGSNLTQLENPTVMARKLRQAVYNRINCGPVLETVACWNKVEP